MLQVLPITFKLYANDEQEIEELRFVITEFIKRHAMEGRAVTASKLADALRTSENNPLIKNRIKRFLDGQ